MQVNNYNPNFCGYKSDFSKKLNKYLADSIHDTTEEQNIIDCFEKTLEKNLSENNIKGRGFHGVVYGIDDDYVFKIENQTVPKPDKISVIIDTALNSLKSYYGNVIAKIGNIEIMRNAARTENSLPAGLPMKQMSKSEKLEYYNNVYLKRFSEIPQSSYDKIAQDFKTLNSLGKQFDTINPNNFTADGDEIKIVDKITDTNQHNPNTLAKLFKVFINSYDANNTAAFDILAVQRRKNLLKKIILAAEKSELPYYCDLADRQELNLAMHLCDYPGGFSDIQRTLTDYRRKYSDINTRLQKISEFLDEFNEPDLISISFYS